MRIQVRRGAYLDKPCPLPEALETKFVGDLCRVHRVGQILLVGKDEQEGVPELVLVEHPLQLLACLGHTFPIVRVDDENDTLGVLEVCSKNVRGRTSRKRR